MPTCTRIHSSPQSILLTADNTGRIGLGKTQVMKNKDVVVGRGETGGGGGDCRRNTGEELFVQTDNF